MSKVISALGCHTERVSELGEVISALRRALDANETWALRPKPKMKIPCEVSPYAF
jgi:hypothetical protein